MLTMNVDIMSPTVAELNEEKMHTDTQKKKLETSEYEFKILINEGIFSGTFTYNNYFLYLFYTHYYEV